MSLKCLFLYPDSVIYEEGLAFTTQVEAQVSRRILTACAENPLLSAEIAAALGHKQLSGNLRKALPDLRKSGLIEYTIPDKPNSRLQNRPRQKKNRRGLFMSKPAAARISPWQISPIEKHFPI